MTTMPSDAQTAGGPLRHADVHAGTPTRPVNLVVDLDHSLVRTDTLVESMVQLLFRKPGALLSALPTLRFGRSAFKAQVASNITLDPATLPYDETVLGLIREHRAQGGTAHLITAADQSLANSISDHLDLFDSASGSTSRVNLKGSVKADLISEKFGSSFSYVGDSKADLAVWAKSQHGYVVDRKLNVLGAARRLLGPEISVVSRPRARLKDWVVALRLHQWAKNIVMFVPLFLSQRFLDLESVFSVVAAFLLFGMTASSTYLLNDLADLAADRAHLVKRKRALASGLIGIPNAFAVALLGLLVSTVGAWLLSPALFVAITSYCALTLCYSFFLKRQVLVDLLVIGCLFGIRMAAGAAVIAAPVSLWIESFTVVLFTSLAAAKRHGEIVRMGEHKQTVAGRGYLHTDGPLTISVGIAAATASNLLMLLYMQTEVTRLNLYRHPELLFLMPIVLTSWLMRVWALAHRGVLHDDPVIFALKDRTSWFHGAIIVALWLAAVTPWN